MSNSLQSEVLSRLPKEVELVRMSSWHVILKMREKMGTAERGSLLLNLEKRLHREVDPKLEVLLEPMGDMNKLRNRTRGVMV